MKLHSVSEKMSCSSYFLVGREFPIPIPWMFHFGICPNYILHGDTRRNFAGRSEETDPGDIL